MTSIPSQRSAGHSVGLWALLASAALVGCSTPVKLDDNKAVPVESRTGAKPGSTASTASTTPSAGANTVTPVDLTKAEPMAANSGRIVYFDFDSYVVKDEYRGVVEGNAKLLSADRKKRVSLEGHTDERGGRESLPMQRSLLSIII